MVTSTTCAGAQPTPRRQSARQGCTSSHLHLPARSAVLLPEDLSLVRLKVPTRVPRSHPNTSQHARQGYQGTHSGNREVVGTSRTQGAAQASPRRQALWGPTRRCRGG